MNAWIHLAAALAFVAMGYGLLVLNRAQVFERFLLNAARGHMGERVQRRVFFMSLVRFLRYLCDLSEAEFECASEGIDKQPRALRPGVACRLLGPLQLVLIKIEPECMELRGRAMMSEFEAIPQDRLKEALGWGHKIHYAREER